MKITRFAGAVGTVALVVALGTSAASAHPAPFTVTAGSAPAGTSVGISAAGSQVTFYDTTTGFTSTCTSASLQGAITTGSSSGTPIATFNGSTVSLQCSGPAGLTFAFTGFGTWNWNVTDSTNGVSTGTFSNFRAHVRATSGPTCSFDIGSNTGTFMSSGTSTVAPGTFPVTYSGGRLVWPRQTTGPLGLWNVNPTSVNHYCIGKTVLAQGDKVGIAATFAVNAVNSAYNPIVIT